MKTCPGCGGINPTKGIACSKNCYQRVRRRQEKEESPDFEGEARRALKARAIEVMKKEPKLELWQLEERFGVRRETLMAWRRGE